MRRAGERDLQEAAFDDGHPHLGTVVDLRIPTD